ncbi:hypothetical protein DW352_00135 [Pseudolabrys taiwanensis]|uniref:Uncharacterized protein n=1 Tax=Pseudolabrys taiwanensis TaxID=331696 RepID=A0A345ZQ69_9HYPH|nr:hypothetical protein [Pseudolabrys taiwanensis]AXK79066.1 hypothetical protein DW352_00135 [Pseudolabrys taiwanensis]
MLDVGDDLRRVWAHGYSIAELWGMSEPVTRGRSAVDQPHIIMWGILGIVEYQVDKGAGHQYLRERLSKSDWIAIGYPEPKTATSRLAIVPRIQNAKFGRKNSAIGDGAYNFVEARILHSILFKELTADR